MRRNVPRSEGRTEKADVPATIRNGLRRLPWDSHHGETELPDSQIAPWRPEVERPAALKPHGWGANTPLPPV